MNAQAITLSNLQSLLKNKLAFRDYNQHLVMPVFSQDNQDMYYTTS